MIKKMSLRYVMADNSRSCTVSVSYTMQKEGNTLSLHCYIEATYPAQLPWLQTRNFICRFRKKEDVYHPVASGADYEKTIDAAMLTDKTAMAIMQRESIKVTGSLTAFELSAA